MGRIFGMIFAELREGEIVTHSHTAALLRLGSASGLLTLTACLSPCCDPSLQRRCGNTTTLPQIYDPSVTAACDPPIPVPSRGTPAPSRHRKCFIGEDGKWLNRSFQMSTGSESKAFGRRELPHPSGCPHRAPPPCSAEAKARPCSRGSAPDSRPGRSPNPWQFPLPCPDNPPGCETKERVTESCSYGFVLASDPTGRPGRGASARPAVAGTPRDGRGLGGGGECAVRQERMDERKGMNFGL